MTAASGRQVEMNELLQLAVDEGASDVHLAAGSPAHGEPFGLPCIAPAQPTPEGLIAAVADWDGEPAPLIPLYLRRPDAKTLAERAAEKAAR